MQSPTPPWGRPRTVPPQEAQAVPIALLAHLPQHLRRGRGEQGQHLWQALPSPQSPGLPARPPFPTAKLSSPGRDSRCTEAGQAGLRGEVRRPRHSSLALGRGSPDPRPTLVTQDGVQGSSSPRH